jgi:predicted DNA-binding transcriptional regulator AlpA
VAVKTSFAEPKKHPTQVALAKKAAAIKAAATKADAKRAQPAWLTEINRFRDPQTNSPPSPERFRATDRSQGPPPPRLISKSEVVAIIGVSFPTIWHWMRLGKFPRSLICGGRTVWIESAITDWVNALPRRRLKGDPPENGRESENAPV